MKIVHVDELPLEQKGGAAGHDGGRGGTGHSGRVIFDSDILERDADRPDNFYFGISYTAAGEFSSPRHRHNFEQMRFMIEGHADYPIGLMLDGTLGIFPEGAYYGPQEEIIGTVLVLQFGGPSGLGYIDRKQIKKSVAELRAKNVGAFEDGTYVRNPGVEGAKTQDAYEIAYENVKQRPIVYPKPQYPSPMLIDSNVFPWTPVEGAWGLSEKALGVFTSCRYRAARYKLNPGAEFEATGRGIYFVLSGAGKLEGQGYRDQSVLYLEDDEGATFAASKTSDILYLGLPSMALMQNQDEPAVASLRA